MRKTDILEADPFLQSLKDLCAVWGIGPVTAQKLVAQNIKSVADLRTAAANGKVKLDEMQQVGLKYHEDLQKRIPRAEVEEIGSLILTTAQRVYYNAPNLIGQVAGSFRRGAQSCGDVDFLFTSPNSKAVLPLEPLLDELVKMGFIVGFPHYEPFKGHDDKFGLMDTYSSDNDDDFKHVDESVLQLVDVEHGKTFMGVARLFHPGAKARRVDIKSFPADNFAFALLYFTGSGHFNRSMRFYANKIGFRLSESGLYPVIRNSKKEVIHKGFPVHASSEEDIFNLLGLEYRAPHERNCEVSYRYFESSDEKNTPPQGGTPDSHVT